MVKHFYHQNLLESGHPMWPHTEHQTGDCPDCVQRGQPWALIGQGPGWWCQALTTGRSRERQTTQSSSWGSSRNKSRMDALFDGATRQIKDTANLALRNETEVVVNRETIQINST